MKRISPKFKMSLIEQVSKEIWDRYRSYSMVETYLEEFQEEDWDDYGNLRGVNFEIKKAKTGKIDLIKTLSEMSQDMLFTVAIDLDIPVPTVLPAFPTFTRSLTKGELGTSLAYDNFMKSYKLVYEDPEQAISLANSALETIIKHILADERIRIAYNKNDTLHKLVEKILKAFGFFPSSDVQKNIKNIGSSLLCMANEIEELRSDKTFSHGKGKTDFVIDDNLYSVFIVNSIITVGLFLISFYDKKYPPIQTLDDEIPF